MKKDEIIHGIIKAALIAFLAFAFFRPVDGETRNLLLLYTLAVLLVSCFAVTTIMKAAIVFKTKKLIADRGFENIKLRLSPFSSWFRGNYRVDAMRDGKKYSFAIVLRKNPWTVCYFESPESIEYYKSSRMVALNSYKIGTNSRGSVYTRCAGRRRISYCEGADVKIAVFNKIPMNVTSSAISGSIEQGMKIFDDAFIYDIKTLIKI